METDELRHAHLREAAPHQLVHDPQRRQHHALHVRDGAEQRPQPVPCELEPLLVEHNRHLSVSADAPPHLPPTLSHQVEGVHAGRRQHCFALVRLNGHLKGPAGGHGADARAEAAQHELSRARHVRQRRLQAVEAVRLHAALELPQLLVEDAHLETLPPRVDGLVGAVERHVLARGFAGAVYEEVRHDDRRRPRDAAVAVHEHVLARETLFVYVLRRFEDVGVLKQTDVVFGAVLEGVHAVVGAGVDAVAGEHLVHAARRLRQRRHDGVYLQLLQQSVVDEKEVDGPDDETTERRGRRVGLPAAAARRPHMCAETR
eukprot:PhM_4_TR5166/c3_g1_i1/m.79852